MWCEFSFVLPVCYISFTRWDRVSEYNLRLCCRWHHNVMQTNVSTHDDTKRLRWFRKPLNVPHSFLLCFFFFSLFKEFSDCNQKLNSKFKLNPLSNENLFFNNFVKYGAFPSSHIVVYDFPALATRLFRCKGSRNTIIENYWN